MNPNLPAEVIVKILAKLDDVSALLTCRLVCRSWNAECLSLLRMSRFRKTVGPADLQKAAQFGTHEGQYILPFRLKHTIYQGYSSWSSEDEDSCVAEFQTMSQGIARLFQICGPDSDCIRDYSLDCGPCGAKGLVAFNNFIRLIAPNLTNFELVLHTSESLSRREAVQIMRKDPVLFPNLKQLSCEICPYYYRTDEGEQEHVESVLIENSRNLETLSLYSSDPFNFLPKDGGPAAFKTLTTLKLDDDLRYPVHFLNNFRSSQSKPILETFDFNTAYFDEDEMSVVADTFRLCAKTLKSTTVGLGPGLENNTIAFPLSFPALPQLQHLRLKFEDIHYPCCVDPQEFNLNQGTLPALNSIEIPFGCMLVTPPPKPHSAQHRFLPSTTFPSVRKLTLRVEKYTFHYDAFVTGTKCVTWEAYGDCEGRCRPTCEHELQISPQAYVDFVAEQFPSVTNLTVWNRESDEAPENEAVELVIKTILESDSVSTLAIETFQINGKLGHNYLRNVLGGTNFTNKLTDLKKIRFESSCKADVFADDHLTFALLAEHFPGLEEIEISPELVVGKNEAERWEKFRLASTKFPAWNIKLI